MEAFNVIGYALGAKPASVKNYRDEFDPLFPNRRKGWHKRDTRDYCLKVFKQYKDLDFEEFSGLVRLFVGCDANALGELRPTEEIDDEESSFAKRLITGLAAEHISSRFSPGFLNSRGMFSKTPLDLDVGMTIDCGQAHTKIFSRSR